MSLANEIALKHYGTCFTVQEIQALDDAIKAERERLWKALKPHWRGDMGPAHIIVNEIIHLFDPSL